MTMRRTLVFAVLWFEVLFVGASFAVADEVVLKNGGRILGKAVRVDGQVRVEMESGTVAFPETYVDRVIPGIAPVEIKARELRERRAWVESRLDGIDMADAQAVYAVVRDARASGFPEPEVRDLLGFVLGADPDHAGARFDLGEERYDGRWVTREEARRLEWRDHAEEMRVHGFVEMRGVWMTPEEADWKQREGEWEEQLYEMEVELADAERLVDARQSEVLELESRVAELEQELQIALDERDELEAEVEKLESVATRLRYEVHALAGELDACRRELADVPRPIGGEE